LLSNQIYTEPQKITQMYKLNSQQAFVVAHGSGPNNYYLLTDSEDFELTYLDIYPYPGMKFVSISQDQFLYNNSASILIQKNPFQIRKYVKKLIFINSKYSVNYSNSDDQKITFYIFQNDPFDEPKKLQNYSVLKKCLNDLDLDQAKYLEREKWFNSRFKVNMHGQLVLIDETPECKIMK